jgi:hypothetical protein
LNWTDAVQGNISFKKKIIRKENCIYIPAMNIKNAKKILKRDFGIIDEIEKLKKQE